MTDITELAQREKFEAWAEHACAAPWGYLKKRRTTEGYSEQIYTCMWTAWKAAGAELVEALKKAQRYANLTEAERQAYLGLISKRDERIAEQEEAEQKLCAANVTLDARAKLAERQLAELESRTVKLPPAVSVAGINVYEAGLVHILLTAAGIKWEAE